MKKLLLCLVFFFGMNFIGSGSGSANAATVTVSTSCGTWQGCVTNIFDLNIRGAFYDIDFQHGFFNDFNAEGKFPHFGDLSWALDAADSIRNFLNTQVVPGGVFSDDGFPVSSSSFDIPYGYNPLFLDPTVDARVVAGLTGTPTLNNWNTFGPKNINAREGGSIYATFALSAYQPVPEPASVVVLSLGLMALGLKRRFSKLRPRKIS